MKDTKAEKNNSDYLSKSLIRGLSLEISEAISRLDFVKLLYFIDGFFIIVLLQNWSNCPILRAS